MWTNLWSYQNRPNKLNTSKYLIIKKNEIYFIIYDINHIQLHIILNPWSEFQRYSIFNIIWKDGYEKALLYIILYYIYFLNFD